MGALTLVREARRAGLDVSAAGNTLIVRGPRRLEPVAQALLARKPSVLRALVEEQSVGWRIEAMKTQAHGTSGPRCLLARPGVRLPPGSCWSCGGAVSTGDGSCCQLCVDATVAVLAALP